MSVVGAAIVCLGLETPMQRLFVFLRAAMILPVLVSGCGGGGSGKDTGTPDDGGSAGVAVLRAVVTRSAPVAVNLPWITGASDPLGGNTSGTAVLDFDGDGLKDMIVTPSYLSAVPELPVILLRRTASGFVDATASAFGPSTPTTGVARTPLIADFNADGRDDFFSADTGLEVLENGRFIQGQNVLFLSSAAGQLESFRVPPTAFNHGACAGDVDGDGRIDAVINPLSPPKTYVLLNRGAGFVFDQSRLPIEITRYSQSLDFNPSSCVVADLDGDGRPDLVAGSYGDGLAGQSPGAPYATGVRIYPNTGNGGFGAASASLPRPPGADWGSTSIRAADFDRNGLLDLLVAWETLDGRWALQLWSQSARGVWEDATLRALGRYQTDIGFWREAEVADFDGDGSVDIYLRGAGLGSRTLAQALAERIRLNDGSGRFASPTRPIEASTEASPAFLVVESASGGRLRLVGYEGVASGNAYTRLVPLQIELLFR